MENSIKSIIRSITYCFIKTGKKVPIIRPKIITPSFTNAIAHGLFFLISYLSKTLILCSHYIIYDVKVFIIIFKKLVNEFQFHFHIQKIMPNINVNLIPILTFNPVLMNNCNYYSLLYYIGYSFI